MDRFNDTTDSAWKIISPLLNMHEDDTVTLIQEEMGKFGMKLPETTAGQELMLQLQKLLDSHKKMIQDLKLAAEKEGDQEVKAALNSMQAEIQKQMERTLVEVQTHKISSNKKLLPFFEASSKVKKRVPSLALISQLPQKSVELGAK